MDSPLRNIPGIDYYVPWSDHFPKSSPSGFLLPHSRYRNIPWTDHFPTYSPPSIEFGDLGIPSADQFPTSPTGTDPPTRRRRRFTVENNSTSNKRARVDDDDDAVFRLQLPEVGAVSGDDCAICLQDLETGSGSQPAPEEATPRAMPCSHAFHECCIFRWLRRNPVCPICRRPLPLQQHQDVDDEDPLQLSTPLPQDEDVDDEDPPQWHRPPRLQLPTPVPREPDVDDNDRLQLTMPVPREMLEIEVL
ncbi:hypothetical protein EJB05_20619, partial [Eragrostis curvula]